MMNPQAQMKAYFARTALLLSSAYVPCFFSAVLLFYPEVNADRPILRFLLALVPFWWAYIMARCYIRMAERSAPLYHPLGCLAQCCVWVFHWVVVLYHAFFVTTYTLPTYLTTVFCVAVVVVEEGLFHNIITINPTNSANLGTYERVRKLFARALIIWARLWYQVDACALQQQDEDWAPTPMRSRSMTL